MEDLLEIVAFIDEACDAKSYCESPALTAEQERMLAAGHGKYVGSCGHVVRRCRCKHDLPDQYVDEMCNACDEATKVFCSTGPGGGVDPSCRPGEGNARLAPDTGGGGGALARASASRKKQKSDLVAAKVGADGKVTVNGKRMAHIEPHLPKGAKNWANVMVNTDPKIKSGLACTYNVVNAKTGKVGDKYWHYTEAHKQAKKEIKFAATRYMLKNEPKIVGKIADGMKKPETREMAIAAAVMHHTGVRVGSKPGESKGEETFGLTTMLGQHVKKTSYGAVLTFRGKSGKDNTYHVKDEKLAKELLARAAKAGKNGKVLDIEYGKTLAFANSVGIVPKDMRTLYATKLAIQEAKKYSPKNDKEREKFMDAVADKVAAAINNTRNVAKTTYIDPATWDAWK